MNCAKLVLSLKGDMHLTGRSCTHILDKDGFTGFSKVEKL